MKFKRYIPLLVLVILAAAAVIQGLRSQVAQPELLQSQVTAAANSLDMISSWELEIELHGGEELEMSYSSRGRASSTGLGRRRSDDDAVEEIRLLVEALPPLAEGMPLGIIQAALDHLEIDESDVKEFELEYELTDGFERKIDLDVNSDDDNDND